MSSLLALAMVLSPLLNTNAFAAESKKVQSNQPYQGNGFVAPHIDTTTILRRGKIQGKSFQFKAKVRTNAYPSNFSLFRGGESHSVDEITPKLKDQAGWGCCWAFSSLGSAESSLYSNGANDVDFSERHLAYFTYHGTNKPHTPEDGTNGDSYLASNPFNNGGGFLQAISTLSRGVGAENESEVQYPTWNDFNNNRVASFTTVDDKYHFHSHYQLREANFLPNRDADGNLDGSAIKSVLQSGTSVAVMFYAGTAADPSEYKKTESLPYPTYYNSQYGTDNADHGVQIVGWNDDVPASEFTDPNNSNAHPRKNGAWLIKNTWGEDYADRGGTYFYISYEDLSLCHFCAFTMDNRKDSPRYAHNYQYDGIGEAATAGNPSSNPSMANVFTATGNQNLDAVAFYTTDLDTDYTIQVYKNVSNTNAPFNDDKVAAVTQRGRQSYTGYHTVDLNPSVKLSSGEKFSIVVTLNNPYHRTAPVAIEYNFAGQSEASISAGQSYINFGSGWSDVKNIMSNAGNLCIKAFTNDQNAKPLARITVSPSTATVVKGGNQQFSAAVTDMNLSDVLWKVSGNTSSSTSIDSSGKLTVGTDETASNLTVRAENRADSSIYSNATITVVNPARKASISLAPTTARVTKGNSQQFSAAVTGMNLSDVLWKILGNTSSSTSIDSTGKLTVGANETASTLTVRAENRADSSIYSSATVTVVNPVPKASISVAPTTARITKGSSQQFSATVVGLDDSRLIWKAIGNTSPSTSIGGTGKLTIGTNETASTLTVQAISASNPSIYGTAQVTVIAPLPTTKVISHFDLIQVASWMRSVKPGTSYSSLNLPGELKAVVDGHNRTTVKVLHWDSSPSYNPSEIGSYRFQPVFSSDYTIKAGTVLPSIYVIVTPKHQNNNPPPYSPSNNNWDQPNNDNTETDVNVVTTENNTTYSNHTASFSLKVDFSLDAAAHHSVINFTLPTLRLVNEFSNNAVNTVNMTVKTPSNIFYNRNENVDLSMNMEKSVLDTARFTQKDITVNIADESTGKTDYSWFFKGSDLEKSNLAVNDLDLAMSIKSTSSDATVSHALPANQSGTLLTFANNGTLPAPATIRAYVGSQNYKTGQTLRLYYYNPSTKNLEQTDSPACIVDSDQYVSFVIKHCSQYILLPDQNSSAVLDTGETLNVKAGTSYQFMVTDSKEPTFVSGNEKGFHVSYCGSEGNHYFYKVTAVGSVGMCVGFYVNHERTPRCRGTIISSAILDTGSTLHVKAGNSYQFMVTDSRKPTFVCGNGNVFRVIYNGSRKNHYFFRVVTVGRSGMCAGFYVNGERLARCCGIII